MNILEHKSKVLSKIAEHFYIFDVDGVEVDIMGDYYVMKEGKEHRIALEKNAELEWTHLGSQMMPLDSIPMWRRHYDVMNRPEKVAIIDRIGNPLL